MFPLRISAGNPEDEKILEFADSRLKLDAANPRLWAARGVALGRLGRTSESLLSFDKSLAISPKFLPALEGAAQIAYEKHDARASAYIDRILSQDRTNTTAHAMAGAIAFEKRECPAAIQHFSQSGDVAKTDPAALAQWGECQLALNNPAAALLTLQQSLALKPDPKVTLDEAVALRLQGRNSEALLALANLPGDAAILNLRAAVLISLNRYADAISSLRQAIALAPQDERNYVDLASLCLDHQSFDVALDIVNAGLSALPKSPALYTLRGAIAAQFSRMEDAAEDFEHASRLEPDQYYSDAGLSLLLEQQDQIEQAIAVVRPRLSRSPESAALHFLLGDLLLKSQGLTDSQRSEAKNQIIEAIRLKPDFAKAHAVLGKVFLQEGQSKEAVTQLNIALQYDPDDRIGLNQLVLAYRRLGRTAEAHIAAERLQRVLTENRRDEVHKNSVRFVRLSSAK